MANLTTRPPTAVTPCPTLLIAITGCCRDVVKMCCPRLRDLISVWKSRNLGLIFLTVVVQKASDRGNCSAYQLASTQGSLRCPRDTSGQWWFWWPNYASWHYAGNGLSITCNYDPIDNTTLYTTPTPEPGVSTTSNTEPTTTQEPGKRCSLWVRPTFELLTLANEQFSFRCCVLPSGTA